jgi:DHA1 family bicyclomycin/chloramphenicol resistance-like MFS transporter
MALVPAIAPIFGSWLLYVFNWRAHFILLLILSLITVFAVTRLQESCKTIGDSPLKLSQIFSQFSLCLSNRNFVGYTLCGGATYAAMFCYISTTSFIVIELLGVEPENFGYTFMSVVIGYITGAVTSSRLVNRWGVISVLTLGQSVRLMPVLFAFFLVFMSGGLCLSIGQMGAISELEKDAGKASSVFGFLQISLGALLGYLVGLFYDNTLLPTAIGVTVAVLLSVTGYLIIRKRHDQDGTRTELADVAP